MTDEHASLLHHLREIRQDLRCLTRLVRTVQIEIATDACRDISRAAELEDRIARIEAAATRSNEHG